ncbi:MAG: hypothetical protein JWP28_1330 [Phenylobacterium sp.]|uniref:TonB-dependent receptor n=1 Tax=Phenylobacterium sp. TaxID=1871053 RepID=UPI0026201316|nr:TonB-dependent receptor [Phenylobacterium sp.]MDB5497299.1 hypothetical protein [Phenylobacterium sp.]
MNSMKSLTARLLTSVAVIAATTTVPGAAAAAEATAASPTAAVAEVIVTARKREEDVERTPVAISVISKADLERRSIQTLEDIQRFTPGLTFQQTPYDTMSSFVGLRGQRASDNLQGQDPSVGEYMDGVYIATTSATNISSLLDLERIEVLKGPQGTLYGRNTTGGSVNIISTLPNSDGLSGTLLAGAGNFDRYEAAGTVNLPLAKGVSLRVSANLVDHSGYAQDTVHHTDLLDEHSRSIRATLRLDPTDKLEVLVRGDYVRGSEGGIAWHTVGAAAIPAGLQAAFFNGIFPATPAQTPAVAAQGLALLNASINSDPHKESYYAAPDSKLSAYGGSITATYALTDQIDLKSITAYRRFKRTADASFVPFGEISTYIDNSTNMLTEELQLQGTNFDKKLNWIAGYYYYDTTGLDYARVVALTFLNPANPSQTDADLKTKSNSVYAQATYAITDKLNATAGVRYTSESKDITARNRDPLACEIPGITSLAACVASFSKDFNNTSYALGADYTVNDSVFVYARTATGFKSGGFNQRANVGTSFLPEKVKDYEVGLKLQSADHRLRANADVFRSNYDQIQRNVIGAVGASSFIRNAAKARIDGAELEVSATPVDAFTISGTLAYVDAKYLNYVTFVGGVPVDISNRKFPGQPRLQSSISASYTVPAPVGDLVGSLDWSYQDLVDFQPDNHGPLIPSSATMQPAYSLWNARLQLNIPKHDLKLAVWVRNLTDKTYFANTIDIESLGIASGALGSPRTYGVEIRKSF